MWVNVRATPWDAENVMTRALKGPNMVFNPSGTAFHYEEYLEGRANRGNREGFERAQAKVKNRTPDAHDQI
jgi:hypothetical protein